MTVVVTVAALVLAGAVLGGCASSGKSVKPSKPTTTLNQAAKDKVAVEATIQGWDRDYTAAKATPGQPHPELAQWATPELMQLTQARVQQLVAVHQATRRPTGSLAALRILSVVPNGPDRYDVETCQLDDYLLVDADSGATIDGSTAIYRAMSPVFRQLDGRWLMGPGTQERVGHTAGKGWEQQCGG